MRVFELDPRLVSDTLPLAKLGLCEMRLMNDSRWTWLILVPQRNDVTEIHDLTPLDQTMLTFEACLVSKALKKAVRADKINVAALGNVVPMFHLHVVARRTGDPNWPKPVWGFGKRTPYADAEAKALAQLLHEAVLAP